MREQERKKKEERKKNAPTESGPLPQSHTQELFVIRVRGNPSLRSVERCFAGADKQEQLQQIHRKQGHTSRIQLLQKMPYRFWRDKQLSERDGTLQCSAGREWNGCHSTNDTLASTWAPAVGQPVRVRWVPRSTQKKPHEKNNCGSPNVVCKLKLCTSKSKSFAPLRSVPCDGNGISRRSQVMMRQAQH